MTPVAPSPPASRKAADGPTHVRCAPAKGFESLLTVCRAYLDHSPCPQLTVDRWQALAPLAIRHRLGPVVWKVLASDPGAAPCWSARLPDLRREVQGTSRWSLFLTAELLRIMQAFDRQGIEAVPLKGPALAQELYGDVSLRVFADLDFITARPCLPAAMDVLRRAGYRLSSRRPVPPEDKRIQWFIRNGRGEIPLVHPQKDVQVDLHWYRLDRKSSIMTAPGLLRSAPSLHIAGRPLPAMRAEDLLLYLASHGFKHGWLRLNWLLDLALLIRRSAEDMDCSYLQSRMHRVDVKVALAVGLALVEKLFGVDCRDLGAGLMEEKLMERGEIIARRIRQSMQENPGDTEEAPRTKVLPLIMAANPGIRRKASCLCHLLGEIGYEDIDLLRLPLWPLVPYLYYPCRCLRLFGKFAPFIGRVK